MKINIKQKYHFYAGHRNKSAGEKCARLHGHTYYVECLFEFDELNNGVSILFHNIELIVKPLIKEYDHYFLLYEKDELCKVFDKANESYIKLPFETSAENMAIHLFNKIKKFINIVEIRLAETTSSTVIYNGTEISS